MFTQSTLINQGKQEFYKKSRELALASFDGYVKGIAKFSKCKQDARDMHAMCAGQIYLAALLDLITEEEKTFYLQKVADAYEVMLGKIYK